MAQLAPFGPFRAFDNNGDPLSGGKLYTYEAGTTTPKDTYTDAGGLTANTNPVELDSAGYADVWLGTGAYKFILKTSAEATLWEIDDINGDSENAFGASITVSTGNLSVNSTYRNGLIRQTGSGTLSLDAAATLGEGFYFIVKKTSAAVVTVDPNGAELINGSATISLTSDAIIICDGVGWYTVFMTDVNLATNNAFTADNSFSGSTTMTGKVLIPNDGTLTIATGAVTVTGANHTLDTEAAAAIDDLDTINGGVDGQLLIIKSANSARDIVITTAGNIVTPDGNKINLTGVNSSVTMQYNGTLSKWMVLADGTPRIYAPVGTFTNGRMSVTAASATGTFTADEVMLGTALGGQVYKLSSYSQAVNLATTGAGGMDTGAAPNNGFVSLYAITTPSGIASILACNATTSTGRVYGGANMPSGYVASALLATLPTNGSGQFKVLQVIDRLSYVPRGNVISTATPPTTYTSFSISSVVPTNAKRAFGTAGAESNANCTFAIASSIGGAGELVISLPTTTLTGTAIGGYRPGAPGVSFSMGITTAQSLFYYSAVNTYSVQIDISAYEI